MVIYGHTVVGARAGANLFTLAQACRANGIAPLTYFEYLYEHLPNARTAEDLEVLLPWNYKRL